MSPLKKETTSKYEGRTLLSFAKEYLEKYEGNTYLARDALARRLTRDKELLDYLLDTVIDEIARVTVDHQHRQARKANILSALKPRKLDVGAAVEKLAKFHLSLILDTPLSGGIKLRDASKEKVLEDAHRYKMTETDARHKRVFLERIASLLKPEQVVGEHINEAKAKRIYEESRNA